jgi:beta-N-acetylhexosaminidase
MPSRPPGPVMLDVAGLCLTPEEREYLRHPHVGGVILFARNFSDSAQLKALTRDIAHIRPELIIAVDQEGGRVQRFRKDGFTALPPMADLGTQWEANPTAALETARKIGHVLARELREHGVDLTLAPVLDLDYGRSHVIGNRAFHRDPETVTALAMALASGLREAGMGCVGKHFPGHGHVQADSHTDVPVDERPFETLWENDLVPYRHWCAVKGSVLPLSGIMPAHVIYSNVDPAPAGFSPFWLQTVLRQRLGFEGVIFSDDLTMEAACVVGGITERAQRAWEAGCDMVLVCNRPDLALALLDDHGPAPDPARNRRLEALKPHPR